MTSSTSRVDRGRPARGASAALRWLPLLFLLATLAPSSALAQAPKPWIPPGADSLVGQAAEAKTLFQRSTGDSIGGVNYRPYEIVGLAARRLLRTMGRENMVQARAVEAVLDSLGLDTEIRVDPEMPYFALLMVRNPYKLTAKAVGFLYWFNGEDLGMQGAQFTGGIRPRSRVWWTGAKEAPYSWGVVDFTRKEGEMHFTLFRLNPNGVFWRLVQYEDSGYEMGDKGTAEWQDVNGDRRYELVAWMPAERDSVFEECANCPKLLTELLFAERPEGFALQDSRLVPSPYATFSLFTRLLAEGNRSQAARLLAQPAMLDKAIAAGWNVRRPRGWRVEYAEPGTAWPTWLMLSFRGGARVRRYAVYFELNRGRWVIRDWAEREIGASGAPGALGPDGKGK